MKEWPDSFWAAVYIAMGLIVCVIALFAPTEKNIVLAVVAIGSNIITGSFTYIQGKRAGEKSVQVPLNAPATTQVTVAAPESSKEG